MPRPKAKIISTRTAATAKSVHAGPDGATAANVQDSGLTKSIPQGLIITDRHTAWVREGPEGANASTETIFSGKNPHWKDGPNYTRGKNNPAMTSALQEEDLSKIYPESDLLKQVKRQKQKKEDKREQHYQAEVQRTLRKSQKEAPDVVVEDHTQSATRSSRREVNSSLMTGRTTQSRRSAIARSIQETIQNVVAGARRTSDRLKPQRESTPSEKMDGTADALSPPRSPDQQLASLPQASASKLQATPSSLSLANFKRRPRQPSILRMVQQSIATDETSIGTGVNADLDEDSVLAGLQRSSPPREEHNGELAVTPIVRSPTISPSGSRKRKAAALAEPIGLSPIASSPLSPLPELEQLHENEVNFTRNSSSPGLPLPENDTTSRQGTPHSLGSHSVNPSPLRDNDSTPQARRSLRKRVSSSNITASSPLSSPPSSIIGQHESKYEQIAAPTKAKRNAKEKHITTAALQAFLPRRRQPPKQKQRDAFDIPSDDTVTTIDGAHEAEDDDIDELQRPAKRRIKSKKNVLPATRKAKAKASSKITNHNVRKNTTSNAKTMRTYGRPGEDKENTDDVSEGCDMEGAEDDVEVVKVAGTKRGARSKELLEAKEKFKDVDEWELEFESCDVTGGSSSPWR